MVLERPPTFFYQNSFKIILICVELERSPLFLDQKNGHSNTTFTLILKMSEETEIPLDIKNDIKLAFNLYKNENNKINKLKLRTLLFSFIMYKYSASDINQFIESRTLKEKELYSFDDVCDLIKEKLIESKERDSDELFNYIVNNKNENSKMSKAQLQEAFKSNDIDVDEKEIDKMMEYMKKKQFEESEENENPEDEEKKKATLSKDITRNQFKQFYVEQK